MTWRYLQEDQKYNISLFESLRGGLPKGNWSSIFIKRFHVVVILPLNTSAARAEVGFHPTSLHILGGPAVRTTDYLVVCILALQLGSTCCLIAETLICTGRAWDISSSNFW